MNPDILNELKASHYMHDWHAIRGVGQDFKCVYCGGDFLGSVNDYASCQLDHIDPWSKSGAHELENIAVSCATCNHIKGSYVPVGQTREEKIRDALRHITTQRVEMARRLENLRLFVASKVRKPNQPPKTTRAFGLSV